jgi:hypothetical protein
LAGRKFEIKKYHKPLKYLLGEHKNIPVLASGRIQRRALILGGYDYSIKYTPAKRYRMLMV